jgi:autotransporter-associated beta strand protein
LFYGGTAAAADNIQALKTDGFQVGANANVNALTGDYYYAAWSSQQGDCTWTGSSNNEWNNAANWTGLCSGAGVPGDTDDLIFPPGASNRAMNNNISGLNIDTISFQTDYSISGNAFSVANGMIGNSDTTLNVAVTADGTGEQAWMFTGDGLTSNGGIVLAQQLNLNGNIDVVGTISGTGNLEVVTGANVSAVNGNSFVGNVTLDGTFTAGSGSALGNAANVVTINENGVLELENGITVQQDIVATTGSTIRNSFASNTLSGDITLNDDLIIDASVSTLTLSGVISGTGSILKGGTGTLNISGSSSNTLTGDIEIDAGTLQLGKTGGANATQNVIVGDSTGAADSAILTYLEDDQIDNDARVTVNTDGFWNVNGHAEFINELNMDSGRVDVADGNLLVFNLVMIEGLIETGIGEIGVANSLSLSGDTTQAVIDGGLDLGSIMGGIDIIGANSALSPDAYIHANIVGNSDIFFLGGDIEFDGDNSLYTGDFTINAGEVTFNGDNILTDVAMSGGQLYGTGPIGNFTVYSGEVHPGNSPGILHVEGDMALSSADTLFFELDGTTPGTGYDRINASDVILNDATLDLDPSVIFTLGTEFIIITGDSISGIFDGLPEGEVFEANGQYFEISYLSNAVTLTVVTEPVAPPVLSNTGIQIPAAFIFAAILGLTSSVIVLNKRKNTF